MPAAGQTAPVCCFSMNFRFQIGKCTEAVCEFLDRAGGQLNVMKLVKLLYLLDRLSLDRRGIPVVGGASRCGMGR